MALSSNEDFSWITKNKKPCYRKIWNFCVIQYFKSHFRLEMFWSSDVVVGRDLEKNAMTKNRFLHLKAFFFISTITAAFPITAIRMRRQGLSAYLTQ